MVGLNLEYSGASCQVFLAHVYAEIQQSAINAESALVTPCLSIMLHVQNDVTQKQNMQCMSVWLHCFILTFILMIAKTILCMICFQEMSAQFFSVKAYRCLHDNSEYRCLSRTIWYTSCSGGVGIIYGQWG